MSRDDISVSLPWSEVMEQATLGALLLDSDALLRAPGLQPAHFFAHHHRLIFSAVLELHARRHPADVVSVFETLRERGQNDDCGGLQYLNALTQSIPSAANIGRHAAKVQEDAIKRSLIAAADKARELVLEPGADPNAIGDAIQTLFGDILRTKAATAPRRFGDLLLERTAYWQDLEAGKITAGIATKLDKINIALGGGIKPGKNIVLAGRPGSGKSSLAWSIACDVAAQGMPVLVLSMEMQSGDLIDRAAANLGRVSLNRLVTGRFQEEDWSRLTEACDVAAPMPLYIDDQGTLSLLDIRAKARRVQQECGGLALVMVDYLQLTASTGGFDKRHHQIEAVSRGMKLMAKELNTTVLLLSQLTRESDKDEPELAHLKESGAIEEDADTVILLHALPGRAPEGGTLVMAKVAKNRQGPRGRLALAFDGETQRWQSSDGDVSRKRGAIGGGQS
jgi:replicative DNA helicase